MLSRAERFLSQTRSQDLTACPAAAPARAAPAVRLGLTLIGSSADAEPSSRRHWSHPAGRAGARCGAAG